ncbi:hypothetical protein L1887_42570 [Cichorium endivia]|nr:hypothetical protein L1887_42570 [Cichorium endivia]
MMTATCLSSKKAAALRQLSLFPNPFFSTRPDFGNSKAKGGPRIRSLAGQLRPQGDSTRLDSTRLDSTRLKSGTAPTSRRHGACGSAMQRKRHTAQFQSTASRKSSAAHFRPAQPTEQDPCGPLSMDSREIMNFLAQARGQPHSGAPSPHLLVRGCRPTIPTRSSSVRALRTASVSSHSPRQPDNTASTRKRKEYCPLRLRFAPSNAAAALQLSAER